MWPGAGEADLGVAPVARPVLESMLGRGEAVLGVSEGARLWEGVLLPPVQDERYERKPPPDSWVGSGGAKLGAIVEIEDALEASSSSALVNRDEFLFLRGRGGSTLPGSSCRSFLCIFAKSPNRRAM